MATLGLAWTWPYWYNSWANRYGGVGYGYCGANYGYGGYPGIGRWWR